MSREAFNEARARSVTDSGWPLVSVVIPAYNAAGYVAEAVDSVLDQDYPNKEVIVVNDGSTDDTVRVLESYGVRIRRIDQANAGAAEARNRGLDESRGEYIGFLDADDVWLPGKLTVQVAYLEQHPEVDMVQGGWQSWIPSDEGSGYSWPASVTSLPPVDTAALPPLVTERSGWIYHRLLTDFVVCTDVVMARRRLIERVGRFDRKLVFGEDFDYWLRASRLTEIHTLDRLMALYRQHEDNTTHGCPARNYAVEIIESAIQRWGLEDFDGTRASARAVRRQRARLWAGFAIKQLRAGHTPRAAASMLRAIALQPLAARRWLLLAYSLLASGGIVRIGDSGKEPMS